MQKITFVELRQCINLFYTLINWCISILKYFYMKSDKVIPNVKCKVKLQPGERKGSMYDTPNTLLIILLIIDYRLRPKRQKKLQPVL